MTEFELLLQLITPMQQSILVLNDHSGVLTVDLAIVKTQVAEMVFWSRIIVGGIVAIIIERIVNGVISYKKNGNGKDNGKDNGKKK